MPELVNRRWTLANRPVGYPEESDFAVIETDVDDPQHGEILVRTLFLSLDPYMRGRMRDRRSYAVPVGIGDVVVGEGVGRVIASQSDDVAVGDIVACQIGWQEYAVVPAHTGVDGLSRSFGCWAAATGGDGARFSCVWCGRRCGGPNCKDEWLPGDWDRRDG